MKSAQLGVSLLFSIFSLISPRTIDAATLALHPVKGTLVYGDSSNSGDDYGNMQPDQSSTMQPNQSNMQQGQDNTEQPANPLYTPPAQQTPVLAPNSGQPSDDNTQNDDNSYQDQEMGGDTDSDSGGY